MRKYFFIGLLACLLFTSAYLIRISRSTLNFFSPHLASKVGIMNFNDQGLILYDRKGRLITSFYQAKIKKFVTLNEISPIMRQSVIAIEDHQFLSHYGFSPSGIIRSAILNIKAGQTIAGGSTITQQLVKNSLLTPRRSFQRKLQELVLALGIEYRYSKADILEMYLNSVYFGQGAFGIEQAAQAYFNKPAAELSLTESSFLAALLPAPSNLSQTENIDQTQYRQKLVLAALVKQNIISLEEAKATIDNPLTFANPPDTENSATHFALMVRDQLIAQFGEQTIAQSGLKITTTLDLDIQAQTQSTVTTQVESLKGKGAGNGAAVVMDSKTGELMALVGSTNWQDTQFGKMNMAIRPRQTGSSFKPLVYATAFEQKNITPASILQDIPRTFGKDYTPRNYDGRFRGPVTVRRALINSLNIPAVSVISQITPLAVIQTAHAFGITSLDDTYDNNLSLALGSGEVSLLELTGAYRTFANQGLFSSARTILNIKDRNQESVPLANQDPPTQAISPGTAYLISNILSDEPTRTQVFGRGLNTNAGAAVKTGTTQSYKDAWTIGYTPDLTIGVWVGNNDNTPMQNLPGLTAAGPIWANLMNTFAADNKDTPFETPSGVIATTVCNRSGIEVEEDGRKRYQEFFLTGTEPKRACRFAPINPSPLPETSPQDLQKTLTNNQRPGTNFPVTPSAFAAEDHNIFE